VVSFVPKLWRLTKKGFSCVFLCYDGITQRNRGSICGDPRKDKYSLTVFYMYL